MSPDEMDAIAEAVARKLAPRLVTPLRLNRKAMAAALGISPRLLQDMSHREHDPCPHDQLNSVPLYAPQLVAEWCSRQKNKTNRKPAADATAEGNGLRAVAQR